MSGSGFWLDSGGVGEFLKMTTVLTEKSLSVLSSWNFRHLIFLLISE